MVHLSLGYSRVLPLFPIIPAKSQPPARTGVEIQRRAADNTLVLSGYAGMDWISWIPACAGMTGEKEVSSVT
jgi:transposase